MLDLEEPTEAVVLRRFDFSETSQVGHLFTRDFGRVAALARGIKRPNADLRGPLDLFARAAIRMRRQRGELQLLVRYAVLTGHPGLRRALPRLHGAYYATELLREGTRDLDPQPELFDLTVGTLAALETADEEQVAALVFRFELGYLKHAGFLPEFGRCVHCSREAPPTGPVRFSESRSGLVCRRCARVRAESLVTLPAALRGKLADLAAAPDPAAAMATKPSTVERRILRSLLTRVLERVLEKELKSTAFLPH